MRSLFKFFALSMILQCLHGQILFSRNRLQRMPLPEDSNSNLELDEGAGEERETIARRLRLRDRFNTRIQRHRDRTTSRICYDLVGCFEVPHANSPLQKLPEAPEALDTKFYLFRRDVPFATPEVLRYDDNGTSMQHSKFDHRHPLKVYIHGYQSRWNEKGVFLLADAFLKLENCNVLVMDWTQGARGPQYASAAANTEIAGRQLGVLLMSMIHRGLDPKKVHLIGFSLGAHVAGCAAEMTKNAGKLLGRISGLDPAGPLFRHNHLKEKSKKLDKSDAHFVDVVHTDSSPVFIDGFGLWEPVGHVDYYANGGQQQPGCHDLQASIVQTTIDRTLNKDNACSHLRAYYLYLESVMNKAAGRKCQFVAYKCPGGLPSFETGQCFPQIEDKKTNPLALDAEYYTDVGRMGIDAAGDGVMYFVTRKSPYFCGTQLQTRIAIHENSPKTMGILYITVNYGNSTVEFEIETETTKPNRSFYALSTAEFDLPKTTPKSLNVRMIYRNYEPRDQNNLTIPLANYIIMDKFELRNINTKSWTYCRKPVQISYREVSFKLQTEASC